MQQVEGVCGQYATNWPYWISVTLLIYIHLEHWRDKPILKPIFSELSVVTWQVGKELDQTVEGWSSRNVGINSKNKSQAKVFIGKILLSCPFTSYLFIYLCQ